MEEIAAGSARGAGIAAHGSDVPATVDETNLALPAAPAPLSGSVAYAGTPEVPEDAAPGCAAAMPDVIVATASAAWAAATPPDMAPAAAPAIAPMVEDTVRGMTLPRASSDVSAACPCRLAAWANGSSPAYRSSDASSVFSADLRRNRRENHPPFTSPESDSAFVRTVMGGDTLGERQGLIAVTHTHLVGELILLRGRIRLMPTDAGNAARSWQRWCGRDPAPE